MSSQKGSAVPKFSAFKGKPESPSTVEEDRRGNQLKRDSVKATNIKDEARHDRRHTTSPAVIWPSNELYRQDGNPSSHGCKPSPGQASIQHSNNEFFTIDTRGDKLIRRYGGNDRYRVPAYRRVGAGRLLGSDSFFRIDRSGKREEFFYRGSVESRSTFSRERKSVLAATRRRDQETVRIRTQHSVPLTGNEEFLPLRQPGKRRRTEIDSDKGSVTEEPSYRSIHGMSKKHENSDSDETYGSDSASEVDHVATSDPIKTRTRELTARVKEYPDDIDSWIELVEHQDVLRDLDIPYGQSASEAEIRSYADIKLSMLEKALKNCKGQSETTSLRLRMMLEGMKVWNLKTATQQWENLNLEHGNDFEIWKAYMTFRQTNLSTFSYADIKRLYTNKLKTIETESISEHPNLPKETLHQQLIVVFSRLTHFIADAGYAELATAAWQAILELHFRRPSSLQEQSRDITMSSLRNFWESEAPRIGDENAKGWAFFESTGGAQEPPEPSSLSTVELMHTRDPYKAWAAIERQKSAAARVPSRTMDEGTEDDPFRVVMYPDLEDLLFCIPATEIPSIQGLLLDAFLVFSLLPPVFGSTILVESIVQDPIISGSSSFIDLGVNRGTTPQEDQMGGIKPPEFHHPIQTLEKTTDSLFPLQPWFTYLKRLDVTLPLRQYSLISNILKQLTSSFSSGEYAAYYLAFQSLHSTNSSMKAAKTLLKQHPSFIGLYVGLARSEFSKGNQDAAKNILSASLGLAGLTLRDRLQLCLTQAWMDLKNCDFAQALFHLCQIPEGTGTGNSPNPAQVLKVRQLLLVNHDQSFSSGDTSGAVLYAEATTLLEYITGTSGKEPRSNQQGDIWSGMARVGSCSKEFTLRSREGTSAHERLLQFGARILFYHASQGYDLIQISAKTLKLTWPSPYRPAFFRKCIEGYLEVFPKNTIFLSLYAWREDRLGIEDRVRTMLARNVLTKANDCISSWAFAIRHEMSKGNAHSTRAAFERAIESDACKHNISIWISYIRYCHQHKELRLRSKDVLYRAIERCPWSKEVLMEAFVTLITDMDSGELRSIYTTLCDKGLRVHVELDDFLRDWKEARKHQAR